MDSRSCVPGNPVYILVNKLKHFFSNSYFGNVHVTVGPLKDCSQLEEEEEEEDKSSTNQQAEELNVGGGVVGDKQHKMLRNSNISLSSKVLQKLQENCPSFVISGTETDFFLPPSSDTHPISHKMVAVRTFTEPTTASKLKADVDSVLEVFIRDICSGLEDLRRESDSQSLSETNPPGTDRASVDSETIQLKSGRQTKFENIRNAASTGTRCECGKQAVQEKCVFCRLESHYLGYDISPQVCTSDLIQPSTQTKLYHKDRILLSCGVLDANKSPQVCCGWLMEVNLDNLVMALSGIADIRLLWSRDQRFKEQFSGREVRLLHVL